jgi:hypothetical protein
MGQVKISIGRSDFRRGVSAAPSIVLKNRYFETNPVLNDQDQTGLIARPRLKQALYIGEGPTRKVFSEAGTFDDAVFTVCGLNLYKVSTALVATDLGTLGLSYTGTVEMAAAANLGTTPERLFITDGLLLWVYMDGGQAIGNLVATAAPANGDVVRIDSTYYQFTTGSVDAGTPAGTVGNPWLVNRTGVAVNDFTALYHAINDSGTAGSEYSTALTPHLTVEAYTVSAQGLFVHARVYGTAGNSIVTTETGANLAWGAGTLANGGLAGLRQVPTPDEIGVISVAHINGYIIVIPERGADVNGRFWWIEPGEVTIDPLNYATAERAPDAINQVAVYSDMFWLCGQTTTESWQMTGNADSPVQRIQGILFDRGCWEGTALKVKDSLIIADQDGGVFQIQGGLKRISRPDIEERIRTAIQQIT